MLLKEGISVGSGLFPGAADLALGICLGLALVFPWCFLGVSLVSPGLLDFKFEDWPRLNLF